MNTTTTKKARITGGQLKATRWMDDPIMSNERARVYDRYARNLHHPKYLHIFTEHYNELARIDRKIHDLNYPCPPPSSTNVVSNLNGTLQGTLSLKDSFYQSSDQRYKSKYFSHLKKEVKGYTLRDHIIEKFQQEFDDYEKIEAIIVKSLRKNGVSEENINIACQNLVAACDVNKEASEITITLKF